MLSQDKLDYAVVINNPKFQWLTTIQMYFSLTHKVDEQGHSANCNHSGTYTDKAATILNATKGNKVVRKFQIGN